MRERLNAVAATEAAEGEFWTTAGILMGLRYPEAVTFDLLKGVLRMKESVTYQAILREGLAEGRAQEAREVISRLGQRRFGDVTAGTKHAIEAISSVDRLDALVDRILQVESWHELLASV